MDKKTYDSKLLWLRKNKIVLKKEKIRPSTVSRLYSFYQRNSLDTPRNLAYGMPKRLNRKLEEHPEQPIYTPKGKITVKQYVKSLDKRTIRQVRKEISRTSQVKFNHRFKSGKVDDYFIYPFRDGKRIETTALNVNTVLSQLKYADIPDLMEQLSVLFKYRKIFYKDRLVGAVLHYDTKDMPDDPKPRSISFTPQKNFAQYLHDMINALLTQDVFRRESTKDGILYFTYLEVFVRTRQRPTIVEQML